MAIIAPSILSADFSELKDQIQLAEEGGAEWFHLDVMDGHFVPNISFGSVIIESMRKITKKTLDVHLMIDNPDLHVRQFIESGADIITVHAEATVHLHRSVASVAELGCKAGVALNPATPLDVLDYILQDIDLVLIMSVNPGFGGQKFIDTSLKKIAAISDRLIQLNRSIHLEVDGGVDKSNAASIIAAGASVLVAGSAIFGSSNIERATRDLVQIANARHLA